MNFGFFAELNLGLGPGPVTYSNNRNGDKNEEAQIGTRIHPKGLAVTVPATAAEPLAL